MFDSVTIDVALSRPRPVGDERQPSRRHGRTDARAGVAEANERTIADRAVGVVAGRTRRLSADDVAVVEREGRSLHERLPVMAPVAERECVLAFRGAIDRPIRIAENRRDVRCMRSPRTGRIVVPVTVGAIDLASGQRRKHRGGPRGTRRLDGMVGAIGRIDEARDAAACDGTSSMAALAQLVLEAALVFRRVALRAGDASSPRRAAMGSMAGGTDHRGVAAAGERVRRKRMPRCFAERRSQKRRARVGRNHRPRNLLTQSGLIVMTSEADLLLGSRKHGGPRHPVARMAGGASGADDRRVEVGMGLPASRDRSRGCRHGEHHQRGSWHTRQISVVDGLTEKCGTRPAS